MPTGFTILLLIVIVYLATTLKICDENQRLAVFRLGRYFGLRGPGLVFAIPSIERTVRIAVNDRGALVDTDTANINNVPVPVALEGVISIGSIVRITGFEGPKTVGLGERVSPVKARVVFDADQRKTVRCDKCGHEIKI